MESILSIAIPLFLVVSFAQNTRVETKDVQPVQRFEQVISGHVTDLNGKYKFRVSEVTYQPGGYVGDHNHAGPGVRVIMGGEFTYVKGDKTTVYEAGEAFFASSLHWRRPPWSAGLFAARLSRNRAVSKLLACQFLE